MKHYIRQLMVPALMVSLFVSAAMAQAPQAPQAPGPTPSSRPPVPLKVLVVISRYDGDKKISSLPYTLAVTANDARGGSIRMGSSIPVPTSTGGNGNVAYTYQQVGTNIDCSATSIDEGRFKVDVSINDSSVMERRSSDVAPTLRSFITNNSVVLKDGQSVQFTAAADKTTGEVVKVDVTLMVEK